MREAVLLCDYELLKILCSLCLCGRVLLLFEPRRASEKACRIMETGENEHPQACEGRRVKDALELSHMFMRTTP
jgi:hypothetical protein